MKISTEAMKISTVVRASRECAAAVALLVTCASAWAQDYAITNADPATHLETRPASATALSSLTTSSAYSSVVVNLPFVFPYYATTTQSITVSANGFVLPRSVSSIYSGTGVVGFPIGSGSGTGSSASFDGAMAPFMSGARINDSYSSGMVYTWTTGVAPTRHLVVSWENAVFIQDSTNPFTFQLQLYEGTGRVVLAYSLWTGYAGYDAFCAIDSPLDLRWTSPFAAGAEGETSTYPTHDFVLDPATRTYSGRLLYDRVVSDATGIGNSVQGNVPVPRCRVELRRTSDSYVYAATTTADDGSFSVSCVGLPAAATGTLAVLAQNDAAVVSAAAATPPTQWTASSSVSFASDASVGTLTLGASADAAGDVRSAFEVARVCLSLRDWASPKTAHAIPQLPVYLDPSKSYPTAYQQAIAGVTPASLMVGSRGAADPDTWDDGVVAAAYGRHVLASISAAPTTAYDGRLDAATDPANAFAQGFGAYLWAAVSGTSTVIDGTGPSSATVFDLETPAVAATKGPDVAGCAAAALYDLLDGANETIDTVDGTSAPDRVLRAADTMTSAPTTATFLDAWAAAGYDGAGAARAFIGNSVLPDDSFEPNDSASEAASLGAVPFLDQSLVLNRFNEDWFSVTLAAAATSLTVDAKCGSSSSAALEVRDAAGAQVLAPGTYLPGRGAFEAATGPLAAGTYLVRVQYVSGPAVLGYSVEAFLPPAMDAAPLRDWTVGRPYDQALGVAGGVPPYALTTPSSFMPPGMGLNSATLHATGVPSSVGSFAVTVQSKDAGDPANVVTRTQTVTIHDVFKIPVAPFVGFPAGRPVDATLPTREGTPPFALAMSSGALTDGLAFDADSFHVTGTATAGPSSAFALDGVDVAGSADHVATRAVVAVQMTGKKTPASLVAGADACGWWFDAVEGSAVSLSVATARRQPRRALTGALLAPDRSLVATGKIVGKSGAVAASRLVCPQSGRYYFVASSADGGAATQLLGTLAVAPPKSGKGADKAFEPQGTTTFSFGALPGSTATVKFAGDRKQGLVAKVVSVLDPAGTPVNFVGAGLKASALGGTLTMRLATGGTWTVVLGATSQTGVPGALTYSYAVKQAKGAAYSAE